MLTKRRKKIDTILGQAKIVRDTLLDINARSQGFCYEASCVLGERLKKLGIEPTLVGGAVTLQDGSTAIHYWLEYKGIILDVTGDQFNGRLRQEDHIPDVLFTKARNVPVYRKFADNDYPRHHMWHGPWATTLCVSCNSPSFIPVES